MHHEVKFYRKLEDGSFEARCSCGWSLDGIDLAELQIRAAVHDFQDDAE